MNKKIIGIVIGVVIIVAIAAGLFILEPWDTDDTTPGTDTTTQDEISDLTNSIQEQLPDKTEEEIQEELEEDLTDEQLKAFNDAIDNNYVPYADENSETTYDEENGTINYTDENGNPVSLQIDEQLKGATDEEAQEIYDQTQQRLQDIINSASGNPDAGSEIYTPPEDIDIDTGDKDYVVTEEDYSAYEENWGVSEDEMDDGVLDPNATLPGRPTDLIEPNIPDLSDEEWDRFIESVGEAVAG